jgi:hypothetical protein
MLGTATLFLAALAVSTPTLAPGLSLDGYGQNHVLDVADLQIHIQRKAKVAPAGTTPSLNGAPAGGRSNYIFFKTRNFSPRIDPCCPSLDCCAKRND